MRRGAPARDDHRPRLRLDDGSAGEDSRSSTCPGTNASSARCWPGSARRPRCCSSSRPTRAGGAVRGAPGGRRRARSAPRAAGRHPSRPRRPGRGDGDGAGAGSRSRASDRCRGGRLRRAPGSASTSCGPPSAGWSGTCRRRVRTGRVRLWVDRSFTIRGAGTVVTGTLGAGTLRVGDTLQCGGPGRCGSAGCRAWGRAGDQVAAVARVAVNLRGVEVDEIGRGDALLTPGVWRSTATIDVRAAVRDRELRKLTGDLVLHVGHGGGAGTSPPARRRDGPAHARPLRCPSSPATGSSSATRVATRSPSGRWCWTPTRRSCAAAEPGPLAPRPYGRRTTPIRQRCSPNTYAAEGPCGRTRSRPSG